VLKSLEDWRDYLRATDAELIVLLQRRMQLAIELFALLRTEPLTLDELEDDLNRLGVLLFADIDDPVRGLLDRRALLDIFARIIREEKRLAEALSKFPS
jgi:hypothetical protein